MHLQWYGVTGPLGIGGIRPGRIFIANKQRFFTPLQPPFHPPSSMAFDVDKENIPHAFRRDGARFDLRHVQPMGGKGLQQDQVERADLIPDRQGSMTLIAPGPLRCLLATRPKS